MREYLLSIVLDSSYIYLHVGHSLNMYQLCPTINKSVWLRKHTLSRETLVTRSVPDDLWDAFFDWH